MASEKMRTSDFNGLGKDANNNKTLNFTAQRATLLSGKVTDAVGNPVMNINIFADADLKAAVAGVVGRSVPPAALGRTTD